jgi:hypothetical protein|tara:strand:+ start:58 stop:279 length:222 start_codon:yes stop_codon:yes gene_type:complete
MGYIPNLARMDEDIWIIDIIKCCESSSDGGEFMEELTELRGTDIRKPGTCECAENVQRTVDYNSAFQEFALPE